MHGIRIIEVSWLHEGILRAIIRRLSHENNNELGSQSTVAGTCDSNRMSMEQSDILILNLANTSHLKVKKIFNKYKF